MAHHRGDPLVFHHPGENTTVSSGFSFTLRGNEVPTLTSFAIVERAMLAPDFARLSRLPPTGREFPLGNRHDETIDIRMGCSLGVGPQVP
jgi:hypothetical protein